MEIYVAIHSHRHGSDTYLLQSEHGPPTEEDFVSLCEIDFDDDEDLEISGLSLDSDIPVFDPEKRSPELQATIDEKY